jgi:hypothetical protein
MYFLNILLFIYIFFFIVYYRFVDTVDVVQTLVNHPDKDLAKKIKIGRLSLQQLFTLYD